MKNFNSQEDAPPVFKKWTSLYWLVILNLAGCLTLFYLFRKLFE